MAATLAVVVVGVIAMAVYGKLNKNHSNKLMRLRVLFQAEDGIRDCLLSRGLGDVYKRQLLEEADQTLEILKKFIAEHYPLPS